MNWWALWILDFSFLLLTVPTLKKMGVAESLNCAISFWSSKLRYLSIKKVHTCISFPIEFIFIYCRFFAKEIEIIINKLLFKIYLGNIWMVPNMCETIRAFCQSKVTYFSHLISSSYPIYFLHSKELEPPKPLAIT